MNVLAAKEVLQNQALTNFKQDLLKESQAFNKLPSKSFERTPKRIKGKWYIEQLVKNTNGSFSLANVLVSKIKEGKFIEQTMFS